jgi:hypothetical protein
MADFKIKDVLVEHSNALRALLRASRAKDKEADKHIKSAVNHITLLLKAIEKYKPQDLPPEIKVRAEKAVAFLKSGEIDEGRALLLEMGRAFDDFLHSQS